MMEIEILAIIGTKMVAINGIEMVATNGTKVEATDGTKKVEILGTEMVAKLGVKIEWIIGIKIKVTPTTTPTMGMARVLTKASVAKKVGKARVERGMGRAEGGMTTKERVETAISRGTLGPLPPQPTPS